MDDPVRTLVAFGDALRGEGLRIGTDRMVRFCVAAEVVGVHELYWAGRAVLVARREEIAIYDRVFSGMFGEWVPETHLLAHSSVGVSRATPGATGDDDDEEEQAALAAASAEEILRRKSFARCTVEELTELAGLMARMRLAWPVRRTRRWAHARDGRLDARRTVRRSLRTGGELIDPAYRRRTTRARELVLLVDVSGSMAAHSRGLLLFAHAALRTAGPWSVFCFGTRLTRLTAPLSVQNVDDALRQVADVAFDRDGGTRIGDSLKAYLAQTGRGAARGAVVVICSDGLDVGPVEELGRQMQRLSRLAHRVIWLNPMMEDPDYAPSARGMAAALPFVDTFLGGHNLASLQRLSVELAAVGGVSRTREGRRR